MQEVLEFMQLPEITSPNGPTPASFPCNRQERLFSSTALVENANPFPHTHYWKMHSMGVFNCASLECVPALFSFLLSNLFPRLHRAAWNLLNAMFLCGCREGRTG